MTTHHTSERSERRQRNMVLGPEIDALVERQAARDGITVTQAVQRALRTREDILSMAASPNRLARITDPDLVVPPGVEVIRLAGGW